MLRIYVKCQCFKDITLFNLQQNRHFNTTLMMEKLRHKEVVANPDHRFMSRLFFLQNSSLSHEVNLISISRVLVQR